MESCEGFNFFTATHKIIFFLIFFSFNNEQINHNECNTKGRDERKQFVNMLFFHPNFSSHMRLKNILYSFNSTKIYKMPTFIIYRHIESLGVI